MHFVSNGFKRTRPTPRIQGNVSIPLSGTSTAAWLLPPPCLLLPIGRTPSTQNQGHTTRWHAAYDDIRIVYQKHVEVMSTITVFNEVLLPKQRCLHIQPHVNGPFSKGQCDSRRKCYDYIKTAQLEN